MTEIIKRILFGDDELANPSDQWMVKRQFQNALEGTVCDFTANPDTFLKMAKDGAYDVLIIDLNWRPYDHSIETKTGYRLLDQTREYAKVRILWTTDEVREKAFEHGATHYVSKHDRSAMEEAIKGI